MNSLRGRFRKLDSPDVVVIQRYAGVSFATARTLCLFISVDAIALADPDDARRSNADQPDQQHNEACLPGQTLDGAIHLGPIDLGHQVPLSTRNPADRRQDLLSPVVAPLGKPPALEYSVGRQLQPQFALCQYRKRRLPPPRVEVRDGIAFAPEQ